LYRKKILHHTSHQHPCHSIYDGKKICAIFFSSLLFFPFSRIFIFLSLIHFTNSPFRTWKHIIKNENDDDDDDNVDDVAVQQPLKILSFSLTLKLQSKYFFLLILSCTIDFEIEKKRDRTKPFSTSKQALIRERSVKC
jgi:hypothetical protein